MGISSPLFRKGKRGPFTVPRSYNLSQSPNTTGHKVTGLISRPSRLRGGGKGEGNKSYQK